jgi:signal transduction histidine kinase
MTLRARILSLTVGATVVVLALFAVPLWLLEQRSAAHDVEQSATDAARGVADYLSASGAEDDDVTAYVDRVNSRKDAVPVAVVTADGTTHGPDLPGASKEGAAPLPATGDHDGDDDGRFLPLSDVDVESVDGGRLVRVGVTTADGPIIVLAYAPDSDVTSKLTTALLPLGGAALLVLLVVGAVAEVVSRRLVRDLAGTADLADTIASGDAVARVPEAGPPEVRRVAHALNGLAGRIDELLAAERETVADLSHRLRTPLTALRLDVESLPPGERSQELEAHVDQLERTLTAVIHQARRSQREGAHPGCRPGPVVAEAVEFWRPLVEDQGRAMEVAVAPDLPEVHCAADDLRAAVDALLENCLAHTPDGTAVAVQAERVGDGAGDRVAVSVLDRGPGFDAEAVRRGRSDRGSTGLGLDIARGCARASGGDFEVTREDRDGATWTVVRLELGPA